MKLFARLIRAIERNSRDKERRRLLEELAELDESHFYIKRRTPVIMARLNALGKEDLASYLERDRPIRSVSQMVEDDCGVPDGLVGEWKGPV